MESEDVLEYCQRMDPYEFEELVAKIWRKYGYDCTVTAGSGDMGIDILATKPAPVSEEIIIQAKRYADGNKIGTKQVREYATLRQQEETADRIILITTSRFTSQAENLAASLDIDLIDGMELVDLLAKANLINSLDKSTESRMSRNTDVSEQDGDSIEAIPQKENPNSVDIEEVADKSELFRSLGQVSTERVEEILSSMSIDQKAELWLTLEEYKLKQSLGADQFLKLERELLKEEDNLVDYWEGIGGNARRTRAVPRNDYPEYDLEYLDMIHSSEMRVPPAIFGNYLVNYTASGAVQFGRLSKSYSTLWEQSIYGNIESSPAIADNKIFVPSFDDNGGDIFILNMWSGDILDRISTGGQPLAPIISEKQLYVKSLSGTVFNYDIESKKRVWEVNMDESDRTTEPKYDTKFYPGISIQAEDSIASHIYVSTVSGNIFALNTNDGKVEWNAKMSNKCWSAPAVAGSQIVTADSDGTTYSWDSDSGELMWRKDSNLETIDHFDASPTGHSSKSSFPPTVACNSNQVCINVNQYLLSYDIKTGDRLWTFKLQSGAGQPAIAGENVFIPDSRRLYGIALETGKGKFTYDLENLSFDATSGMGAAVTIGLAEGLITATTWGNTVIFG
jgi:outer membrane protein assembly factor BamB